MNGRPRKTQEELDAEMEDYWGKAGVAGTDTATRAATNGTAPAAAVQAMGPGDDDIDMIE